jgi:hypothetical protein
MKFRVTSPYGALEEFRDHPHTGIDLSMPTGTDIMSPVNGVVERLVDYGSENIGKGVIIRTEDGERLIFGHLSEYKVKVGEYIHQGDLVGLSGNTGNSTGPHLHVGLKENGEFVDPSHYVDIMNDPTLWDQVKDFLLMDAPLGRWLLDLGFNIVQSEVFFLIPAILLIGIRILMGKNFTASWIIPLLYAYFVSK